MCEVTSGHGLAGSSGRPVRCTGEGAASPHVSPPSAGELVPRMLYPDLSSGTSGMGTRGLGDGKGGDGASEVGEGGIYLRDARFLCVSFKCDSVVLSISRSVNRSIRFHHVWQDCTCGRVVGRGGDGRYLLCGGGRERGRVWGLEYVLLLSFLKFVFGLILVYFSVTFWFRFGTLTRERRRENRQTDVG